MKGYVLLKNTEETQDMLDKCLLVVKSVTLDDMKKVIVYITNGHGRSVGLLRSASNYQYLTSYINIETVLLNLSII